MKEGEQGRDERPLRWRRVAPVVRFELLRRVRWRILPAASVLYVAFVVGAYRWGGAAGVEPAVRNAGYGLLLFTHHAGFGVDRELAYDDFVVGNLVEGSGHVVAKLIALAVTLSAIGAGVWLVVALASAGELHQASWHATRFLLLALYFVPLVLGVELVMETRLPLVGGFVLILAGILVAALVTDGADVTGWLGLRSEPYRMRSLAPLALRAFVLAPVGTLALYPLLLRRIPATHSG